VRQACASLLILEENEGMKAVFDGICAMKGVKNSMSACKSFDTIVNCGRQEERY
jgi:hypothetical protein